MYINDTPIKWNLQKVNLNPDTKGGSAVDEVAAREGRKSPNNSDTTTRLSNEDDLRLAVPTLGLKIPRLPFVLLS